MTINSFVFGVRFKNFSIQDKLGSIVDYILDHHDGNFNRDFFDKVGTSLGERSLINEKTSNKLIFNSENIIFDYNIKDDFKKELNQYLESFNKIILTDLFNEFNLKQINRFGFVIRTKLKENDLFLNNLIKLIDNNSYELGGFSYNFNLTKKTPLEVKKNHFTEDYENDIVSYERFSVSDEVNLFLDYQKYFKPSLKVIDDAIPTFKAFCNSSIMKFEKKYLTDGKKK